MDIDKECSLLGILFQSILSDLKTSSPAWEDLVNKGTKLHGLLRSTTSAVTAFVDSIQKIADIATNTKGSTKDIGSSLTRICVKQKMMEEKLKLFTNSLMESLLSPMQDHLEEWKKVTNQLEKDHSKDYKKAMHEIRKRNTDAQRLQKKARKGSKSDVQQQLTSTVNDVNDRFSALVEAERSAVRNVLVEERSRLCLFANCLAPVLEHQVSMLNEVSHIPKVTSEIARLCRNPKQLPTSTDQLVEDFISSSNQSPAIQDLHISHNGEFSNLHHGVSPPTSPISSESRKSSICSLNSSESRSSGSLSGTSSSRRNHYQSLIRRSEASDQTDRSPTSFKSSPVSMGVVRQSSYSSNDSGMIPASHHGRNEVVAKPPLPPSSYKPPTAVRSRHNSEHLPDCAASPRGQNKAFSWKDWARPGPYDITTTPPDESDGVCHVLPNRPQAPPSLSMKTQITHHRMSIEDTPSQRERPPLFHTGSDTNVYSMVPHEMEMILPPPPPAESSGESTPIVESLPPPPTSLFTDAVSHPTYHPTQPPPVPNYIKPYDQRATPLQNAPPILSPSEYGRNEFISMTLDRKCSNSSLHQSISSGYGSHTTTPACSEDTIASSDTDPSLVEGDQSLLHHKGNYDYQKFSTLPRNYHHHNNNSTHARSSQHKRPASTADIPGANMIMSAINTPGTATIRRKPCSKFNTVRRTYSVPKAVKPPTVPVEAVTAMMSTFQPPQRNMNRNNSVNSEASENSQIFSRNEDSELPQSRSSASRDFSLQFSSRDAQDGSPTPTMTPTMSEYTMMYKNYDFHAITGVTPLYSNPQN